MLHKSKYSFILKSLILLFVSVLSACDGNTKSPELMKAVKQFESDEIRDAHVENMRINHMDELLHKRDDTVINGIRTKKHSLKACINCHVPEQHNGKVLRHTDQEHFCTTCHTYVAAQLDCFTCHVDHPNNSQVTNTAPKDAIHNSASNLEKPSEKYVPSTIAELNVDTANTPKKTVGDKQ